MTSTEPGPGRLREIVGVRSHPTVVRLDHLESASAEWIEESYHLTSEIRNHLDSVAKVLGRPHGAGMFLVGQYGSGKSHFLAYLTRRIRAGAFGGPPRRVVTLSLLNYRGEVPLEEIVCQALTIPREQDDRRHGWSALAERHPEGILLILDEVSEFLRSKPSSRAFNEDVRFLQFLGEWAQGERLWILAAMQEQIEHTGELEYGLFSKIKDRYPIRLLLTATHVHELVRDGVLRKLPGYDEAVATIVEQVTEALPHAGLDPEVLRTLYPVHPAALSLLEEIRDRFSQARGVVDFVVTRLGGDPARHIPALLDEPLGTFLAPDAIADHFRDQLELQSEFQPLAQRVLPWAKDRLHELFPTDTARVLAERLIKLLVLVHLSPARDALSAEEATAWLCFRPSRLDPERNTAVVRKALDQLCDHGRFVGRHPQGGYRIALEDDGGRELERRLQREVRDIEDRGETLFEWVAPLLSDDAFNPLALPRDTWQSRKHRWHFHDHGYGIFFGNGNPPPREGIGLVVRLPWGSGEPDPAHATLIPTRIEPTPSLVELAALQRLRELPLGPDSRRRLEARLAEKLELFRAAVRQSYADVRLVGPTGELTPAPRLQSGTTLDAWLGAAVEVVLRRSSPTFDRFAPAHGPLPAEAYRSLMRFLTDRSLEESTNDDAVRVIREAYLLPMGLLQRRGRDYVIAPNLERNELVRLVMPLVEQQPAPKTIYAHLGGPGHGLVPDQISLLLIVLMMAGELDVVKGKDSYRDVFETLPHPIQYDRLIPGTALGLEELRDLQLLCDGLGVKSPKQWTVLAQRQAVRRLREIGRSERDRWQPLVIKLMELGQAPELVKRLRGIIAAWRSLGQGDDELQGFQQFRYEIGSAGAFLALIDELKDLPIRLDGLLREIERFRHLLGHPKVASAPEGDLALHIEALGPPPPLDSPDVVDAWLQDARALYDRWKSFYRERHDAYWSAQARHPVLAYEAPAIARSRHLELGPTLDALARAKDEARKSLCRGLSNLDFQPLCLCGFDGAAHTFDAIGAGFEPAKATVHERIERFFARDEVRRRLEKWVKDGIEVNPRLLAYTAGQAPWPEVSNLDLLDRHLAGIEIVQEIDQSELLGLVADRTWTAGELEAALRSFVGKRGSARLRFRAAAAEGAQERVVRWCLEQALAHASPLPEGLGAEPLRRAASAMRPEWVSPAALEQLGSLGIGADAIDRILAWLLEDKLAFPPGANLPGPVLACREVTQPSEPKTPRELGQLAARLYAQHVRLQRLAGSRWLERLDALAATKPSKRPPSLEAVLASHGEASWLLIDAFGWPLVPSLGPRLGSLLGRTGAPAVSAAMVGPETTTDACHAALAEARLDHPFEKVNAVDDLLHEAMMPFDDLVARAKAELEIALRKLAGRFDPSKPVLVFADHGFRIAPDGRSYQHGGASTLERLVPVLRFA